MINYLDNLFFYLNNNNYFVGLMMILLNISGKYLMVDLGKSIDVLFKIQIIRRIMLFTVFFTATRNIKVSIILTGIVILLTMELFNENSKNCIFPKWLIKKLNKTDINTNNLEITNSINILKKHGILR